MFSRLIARTSPLGLALQGIAAVIDPEWAHGRELASAKSP